MQALNLIGTGLIVVAVIIHIVCLATPYYFSADFSQLKDDMKGADLSPQDIKELAMIAEADVKIDNGLWKLCFSDKLVPNGDCKTWDDKLNPGDWLKGAQAMAVLGAIVIAGGAILSGINLVVESRGDRLRILPMIICGVCCFGGLLTLIGAVIVAAEYKSELDLPNAVPLSQAVKDILGRQFYLNWGFGLDIVAFVLALAGGLVNLLAGVKANSSGFV